MVYKYLKKMCLIFAGVTVFAAFAARSGNSRNTVIIKISIFINKIGV